MSSMFKPFLVAGFLAALSWSSFALADTSCADSIGATDAQALADQCIMVSPATHPPCNPLNSCDMIKDEIIRGCNYIKNYDGETPDFCLTAEQFSAADPAPTAETDTVLFQTPSKNIFCIYYNAADGSGGGSVYCEIEKFTPSFDEAYALSTDPENLSCKPEDLSRYELSYNSSSGQNYCPIDDLAEAKITYDPVAGADVLSAIVDLGYGSTFEKNGISCTSEKTGLTCKNTAGHGFSLSKAKQKIF